MIPWQEGAKDIKSRIAELHNRHEMADMVFIIGPNAVKFPAHKLVLSITSHEFFDLFYLMETNVHDFKIKDISAESFESFLKYVYKDILELSCDNLADIWRLASAYRICHLEEQCIQFLAKNMNVVFKVYEKSLNHDLPDVEIKCLELIGQNSPQVFENKSFVNINRETLEKVLDSDLVKNDDIKIVEAIEKWAENRCKINGLEVTDDNKQDVLGKIKL